MKDNGQRMCTLHMQDIWYTLATFRAHYFKTRAIFCANSATLLMGKGENIARYTKRISKVLIFMDEYYFIIQT